MLNGDAPEKDIPSLSGTEAMLSAYVRDYYATMGIPLCQIASSEPVSWSGGGSGSTTGDAGETIVTGETCATLPPLPSNVWVGFRGGFGDWSARCNGPTEILPGSSFELTITSVGVLTSDSLGADPLDASADHFDWDAATEEILSNSFHGTFTATLVAGDAGSPVYVKMSF